MKRGLPLTLPLAFGTTSLVLARPGGYGVDGHRNHCSSLFELILLAQTVTLRRRSPAAPKAHRSHSKVTSLAPLAS
jgi:hypothetical protein